MRNKCRPYFMLVVTALTGCATAPVVHQFDRSAEILASFGDTWDAIIEVMGENSWPIDNMERASGFVSTDWMINNIAGSVDCGSPPLLYVERNRQIGWNIVARESANGTTITINVRARAEHHFEGSIIEVRCESRGIVEALIRDGITAITRGG